MGCGVGRGCVAWLIFVYARVLGDEYKRHSFDRLMVSRGLQCTKWTRDKLLRRPSCQIKAFEYCTPASR